MIKSECKNPVEDGSELETLLSYLTTLNSRLKVDVEKISLVNERVFGLCPKDCTVDKEEDFHSLLKQISKQLLVYSYHLDNLDEEVAKLKKL